MQKRKEKEAPGSQGGDLGIIMGIDNEEVDEHDEHDSQYIPCSKQGNYWPGKPLPTVKYKIQMVIVKVLEGEKG